MASVRTRTSDNARSGQNMNPSLAIVYRDIEELEANPENPRLFGCRPVTYLCYTVNYLKTPTFAV
jgi:hypothetical protein